MLTHYEAVKIVKRLRPDAVTILKNDDPTIPDTTWTVLHNDGSLSSFINMAPIDYQSREIRLITNRERLFSHAKSLVEHLAKAYKAAAVHPKDYPSQFYLLDITVKHIEREEGTWTGTDTSPKQT